MKKIPLGAMLFALVWALALLLPPVRELSHALPVVLGSQGESFWGSGIPQSLPANDPVAQVWTLEQRLNGLSARERPLALHQLDAVFARHPQELWIAAFRLERTLNSNLLVSDTGEMRAPEANALPSASELDFAARLAAQAGAREPDNAFWPWMEALFRFTARRNPQALVAMERAGQASRFEDYLRSIQSARLRLWQRHAAPPWEQRLTLYFSAFVPSTFQLGYPSQLTARAALAARQRGDHGAALRWGAAVLRANELLQRDSNQFVGSLVAQRTGRLATRTILGIPKQRQERINSTEFRDYGLRLARAWSAYAHAHARNDLAARADWLGQPFGTQEEEDYYGQGLWAQFGLPAGQARFGACAPLLLFGSAALCALWSLLWTIGALTFSRRAPKQVPSRGQVAACANFAFWALTGVLLVGFQTGWLFDAMQPFVFLRSDTQGKILPFLFLAGLVFACWLAPIAFICWKRDRRLRLVRSGRSARPLPRWFGKARVVFWLLFGVSTVAIASDGRGLWDGTPLQLDVTIPLAGLSVLLAVGAEVSRLVRLGRGWPRPRFEGEAPRSSAPRWLILARAGAYSVVAVCVLLLIAGKFTSDVNMLTLSYLSLWVGLVALFCIWRLSRRIGRSDGFALGLLARSAGVLALVWSFVFAGVGLVAWPIRAELNHQLERRLAMRESDWIKEQLAKYPPPKMWGENARRSTGYN